jgi:dTDP-glucose 4,6-dehydratase
MNNIGERQDPEKFVPHTIRAMCMNKRVTIHGNRHVIGSRCWIHPRNFASGVMFLMLGHGTPGEIYHIAGEELTNLQVAEIIADELNVPLRYKLLDFHHCRPGHDLRYALDDRRIREMGWSEPIPFDDSFRKAIRWMVDPMNSKWLGLDKGAKS